MPPAGVGGQGARERPAGRPLQQCLHSVGYLARLQAELEAFCAWARAEGDVLPAKPSPDHITQLAIKYIQLLFDRGAAKYHSTHV